MRVKKKDASYKQKHLELAQTCKLNYTNFIKLAVNNRLNNLKYGVGLTKVFFYISQTKTKEKIMLQVVLPGQRSKKHKCQRKHIGSKRQSLLPAVIVLPQ